MRNILTTAAIAAIVMSSCMSPGRKESKETFRMINLHTDSTLYATCMTGMTDMDSMTVLCDNGDTLTLWIGDAMVCGNPQEGNPLAIMRNSNGSVRKLVDLTMLMGAWVEPDPIDEGEEMGISLLEGGDASSINSRVHNYTRWTFHNGHLLLTSQNDIGGMMGDDVIDTFNILKLSPDSLVMESGGYTFHYAHPSTTKRYDPDLVPPDTTTDYLDFLY